MSFTNWMEESTFWGLLILLFAVALGLGEHLAYAGAPLFAVFAVATAALAVGHAAWLRIQTWERRP
jgi:hypothetical protein